MLLPATKLGQGSIFTAVCDSDHRVDAPGPGGTWIREGGAWSGGAGCRGCLVPEGPGSGGGGLVLREGCLVETPRMATAAGGTHPTGMHSCFPDCSLKLLRIKFLSYTTPPNEENA